MSWQQLVQLISADTVARLAAAGLPPLIDGAILLGPEHTWENSSPPRIVMVPTGSEFFARSDAPRGGRNNPKAPGAGVRYANVLTQGIGYTTATVTFGAPPSGITATGLATINGGAVNRIVLTNPGSGYLTAPSVTITGDGAGASASAKLNPSAELLSEISIRSLWSEHKKFRVNVWACTYTSGVATPNPDSDWDFAEMLYQVLIQSLQGLLSGIYRIGRIVWVSSLPNSSKLDMIGRMAEFDLEIFTPVPDTQNPFVPVGTLATPSVYFQPADGSAPEKAA